MFYLLVLHLLLFLQEDESQSSRGVQEVLEQPILVEFYDGVPPKGLGRLVQKELTGLSCVSRFRSASDGTEVVLLAGYPKWKVWM